MTSPYTATSRIGRPEWERLSDACPTVLRIASEAGGARANVFAESRHAVRYRLRQTSNGRVTNAPSIAVEDQFLEGCSVCVEADQDRAFTSLDSFDPEDLAVAMNAAAHSLERGGASGRRLAPLPGPGPDFVSAYSYALPEAQLSEFVRGTADMCFSLQPRLRAVEITVHLSGRRVLVAGFNQTVTRRSECDRTRMVVILKGVDADGRSVRVVRGSSYPDSDWLDVTGEFIARESLQNLKSKASSGGNGKVGPKTSVVLDAGWCAGVWIHELVGHQMEADNIQRGWSALPQNCGRVNEAGLTVGDQPQTDGLSGTILFDDEGTPAVGAVLMRDGHVSGKLHDLMTAEAFDEMPTGNARRQDYRFAPIPRITNLVVSPGPHSRKELLSAHKKLVLVKSISGGRVDARTGRFRFVLDHAEIIERGEITSTISDAVVEGNTLDALRSVAMIGSDMASDNGRGRCVKHGQVVDVGVLAPSILIEDLAVRSISE